MERRAGPAVIRWNLGKVCDYELQFKREANQSKAYSCVLVDRLRFVCQVSCKACSLCYCMLRVACCLRLVWPCCVVFMVVFIDIFIAAIAYYCD